MESPKILLVDDTPANLTVLRKTLENEGYAISVATSGELALKLAPKFLPDLILLDIMMPEMDGYETCTRLKKDESTRDISIIFITAKNEVEDIVKGFKTGGVDYITKPFKQEEVRSRVQTHVELRRLNKLREKLIVELEEKNRHLAQLNETKNKFLGIAAHDLRNPLASIRGFSGILLKEKDKLTPKEDQEFMTIIHETSHHMLTLVNDLLDFSVIESGKLVLDLKMNSLEELLQKRIRVNDFVFQDKKIKIHTEFSIIPKISIDSNRISQVIDNLLTNAAKFSPLDSKIYVTLKQEDGYAKISVKDEGPGISPEDQGNLFKGFQKLSAKPTAGEKSTGLGLAIVKKMVDAHNGTLKVESQLGSGTTFSVLLPIH